MKKLSLITTYFFIFLSSLFAYSPWEPLVKHLNTYYSYGNIESYTISNITNQTVTFNITTQPSLFPGGELVIKKQGTNPLSSETLGFARFLGFFNQIGSAQIVYKLNSINKNDYLIKPFNRKVVLFTNVQNKYSFKPYIDLQQALTFNNFTIYEINKPEEVKFLQLGEYNLLVRLDVSPGIITAKIQSLYDNSILFNQGFQFPYQIGTNFPPNVKISLSQPQIQSKFFARRSKITNGNKFIKSSKKDLSSYSFTTGRAITEKQLTLSGDFEVVKYKLRRTALRIVATDVDGDGKDELVTLNNYGINVYKFGDTELKHIYNYPFTDSDIIAVHLHAGDFNKNGKAELFISLTKKYKDVDSITNKLCSIIIEYSSNNKFNVLNHDLEYFLRVVEDRNGTKHIICQEKGEYEPYEGAIREMNWTGSRFKVGRIYEEAKNVYSIYGFAPHPDKKDYTIIIDKFGNIAGYYAPKEEKVELLSENMGIFKTISFPIKLKWDFYRGGYDRETSRDVYAYRRFEYKKEFNKQVFTIKTSYNKDITRKIISKVIRGGNEEPDKIIGIRWLGSNLIKTWESDKFYETVLDFSFLKIEGKEVLAVLLEDPEEGFIVKLLK